MRTRGISDDKKYAGITGNIREKIIWGSKKQIKPSFVRVRVALVVVPLTGNVSTLDRQIHHIHYLLVLNYYKI